MLNSFFLLSFLLNLVNGIHFVAVRNANSSALHNNPNITTNVFTARLKQITLLIIITYNIKLFQLHLPLHDGMPEGVSGVHRIQSGQFNSNLHNWMDSQILLDQQ